MSAPIYRKGDEVEIVRRGVIVEVDPRDPARFGIGRPDGFGADAYFRTDDDNVRHRPVTETASADLEDALGVLHWLLTDRQDVLHVAAMAAAQGDAMRSAVIANAARGWIEACARLAEVCDPERGDHG
ncbi:hypothetical protein [Streptomyces sp.]|uniref:hypothetical protein n=1 Tax=Streptomyces sp. TaxID=1931 RepID=UPI002F95C055